MSYRRPHRASLKALLIAVAVYEVWYLWAYWPALAKLMGWA